MKVGSLFSGGGLGDFGFMAAGMEIAWQCEIDEYCQKILSLRYPESKKYRDIKTLKGADLEPVDILTGGFPCQDISGAGLKEGITGQRSGLWKEMLRIICEIRPRYIVVENVSALLIRGMGVVLGDLASVGYDSEWECFPASTLGSPHERERVWIVAYPHARNSPQNRLSWGTQEGFASHRNYFENEIWNTSREKDALASTFSGMANGLANRVDRGEICGNGQVPACTYVIGKMIMEVEYGQHV